MQNQFCTISVKVYYTSFYLVIVNKKKVLSDNKEKPREYSELTEFVSKRNVTFFITPFLPCEFLTC